MYRLLWLLMYSTAVFAQSDYKVEHFQSTDGLPSDVVFMTLKKDGFLYLATQKGLCMYDGYIFVNTPTFPNSVISISTKGDKIYGEESGVGLFETGDIYNSKRIISKVNYYDDSPDNDHYKNIYKDNFGNIWCTDFHFLKYINPIQKKQKNFRITSLNTFVNFKANYIELGSKLFIASSFGLYTWDKSTDKLLKSSNLNFSAAFRFNDKILLLTQNGEIYDLNQNTQQIKFLKKAPFNNPVKIADSFISDSYFLIYDSQKIYQYYFDKNEVKLFYESESIINDVFYDKETHLFWISTKKGLIKLTPNNGIVSTINLPDDTKTSVTDIVEDENGSIWLIKNSKYLYRMFENNIEKADIQSTSLNRLSFSDNQLLVATNSGVFRKESDGNFKKIISTDYSVTKAIYFNQKYWLIPELGMIKVFDSNTLKEISDFLKNDEDFYRGNLFNDIIVSNDNQLWLASWMPRDFGISKFNPDLSKFEQISNLFDNEKKFVADYFNRIANLKNGNLAFSSTSGFNIVTPQGEVIYAMETRDKKISSDNIVGIGEDKNGNIWFGCAEGLYLYDLKNNKPTRIAKTEGLHSNNITYGFLIDRHNNLYISNEQTLERINLNQILETELIEKLEISSLKINDIYYPISPSLRINEKEAKHIEFFFSALNFKKSEKLNYRYKFDNENWQNLGAVPKLSLINFPPGKYKLTIEVSDNLGNVQLENIQFNLHIIPRFYKTKWFYILLILLVAGFIVFANRVLVNHKRQKENLQKKIIENENKILRTQMNPHFIFNSLNSINSFIIQNKQDEAEKYLTKFSKLMRNILDNSRKDTIPLAEELSTIKLYLDLENVRTEHKFDYIIEISKDIDQESVKIPPLILQPFLENAIWHGIIPKKGKGIIEISIKKSYNDDNKIVIKIKDNGVGRVASSKINNQLNVKHLSYGIDITKERLALSGSGNRLEITDLYSEPNHPSGTLITLIIKVNYD